jgi:hypothetical protein
VQIEQNYEGLYFDLEAVNEVDFVTDWMELEQMVD